ncbi:Mg-dependent DNase [Hahella sp. CCB-MM4]|uniref:TatD family hydrolase n=1 Tax=Hahella sp. (strain CCB-MM4) TaxID=1926491 RepID=UPI000B9A3EC6|nr:TatD family hydrolase [Hahella sp. CCB-MM4]OZG73832.1 Mg-dependent DNase [Hahella sp. CCB-MM4]
MIDIGVNLSSKLLQNKQGLSTFDSLQQLVDTCKDQGMTGLIAIGTSLKQSIQAIEYARLHPGFIHATAGIHPHDAKDLDEAGRKALTSLITAPEVVAVGEMGLDFNRNFSPPPVQEEVFEFQLDINQHQRKPLYLHERDALQRQLEILRAHRNCFDSGVVHCFTGDKDSLRQYLDMGFCIGITGWVCDERRGSDLVEAIPYLPLERLLIETDSPYLIPRTLRPKPKSGRNQPWFVSEVARKVAELKNLSLEEVIAVTTGNAQELFALPAVQDA